MIPHGRSGGVGAGRIGAAGSTDAPYFATAFLSFSADFVTSFTPSGATTRCTPLFESTNGTPAV